MTGERGVFWAGLVFVGLVIGGQWAIARYRRHQAEVHAAKLRRAVYAMRIRAAVERAAQHAADLGFTVVIDMPGLHVPGRTPQEAAETLLGPSYEDSQDGADEGGMTH